MKVRASLVLILLATTGGFSQTVPAEKSAPTLGGVVERVEWKRYKISAEDRSIELPKMPVRTDLEDVCKQERTSVFHAYAEHAVYEFRFVAKGRQRVPDNCGAGRGFGPKNLAARLDVLRRSDPTPESSDGSASRPSTVFRSEKTGQKVVRWVIAAPSGGGWIEVAVNRRPDAVVDEGRFLNSVQFSDDNGIEIGSGADSTIGDAEVGDKGSASETKAAATDARIVLSTPRARYTEAARNAATQGSVSVRATLLANGAIGAVSVVRGLENGLNEQALAAAKKIVFLPKRVNGVPVSVVQTFEYSFSIY